MEAQTSQCFWSIIEDFSQVSYTHFLVCEVSPFSLLSVDFFEMASRTQSSCLYIYIYSVLYFKAILYNQRIKYVFLI